MEANCLTLVSVELVWLSVPGSSVIACCRAWSWEEIAPKVVAERLTSEASWLSTPPSEPATRLSS